MVDEASAKSAAIRRYRDDLKEYGDLRNAIVHERTDGHAIAEPHTNVVSNIESLSQLIADPPTVLPLFRRSVQVVDVKATISTALEFFFPKNFSQVPVVAHRGVVGLLTTNTVSRWLAAEVGHELVNLPDHSVSDVLKFSEHGDNWRLVSRDTTLAEVVEAFAAADSSGKRLDAVLVTQSGKPAEGLLGIITIHDMPKLLRELMVGRRER